MRLRRTLAALLAALVTTVSLVACGSAPVGPDLSQLRDDFVGSWELRSAEFSDQSVTEDYYDLISETYDMHVTMDLDDQGALLVDAFGEQQTGTWEIKDESTLTLTLGDESVDVPYADGTLTLTYEGDTMVFEKASDTPDMDRDPSVNAGGEGALSELEDLDDTVGEELDGGSGDAGSTGDSGLADTVSELFSDEMYLWADGYAADVTVSEPLDVTVADDETCLIKVTGVGSDFEGDTGYLMTIENRTTEDLVFTNVSTTLDGVDVYYDATLARPVHAGETVSAFFFFDQGAATVTASSTCEFSLAVLDQSGTPVGFYEASV